MNNFAAKLLLYVLIIILSCILEVQAKYCLFVNEGQTKYFQCGPFQHCCGMTCCDNFGSFYRLWYFWLCVMLALLFCSFGGYWYRRHYFMRHVIASSNSASSSRNMTTMIMMNNVPTSNHYDVGTGVLYPTTYQRYQNRMKTRLHYDVPPLHTHMDRETFSHQIYPQQTPVHTLSTPPPSYYETVCVLPPPDYAHYSSQANSGRPSNINSGCSGDDKE